MNLNGDGTLDGHITIKKGQGITQAIAAELGLNEADCKKLGSIWTQIVNDITQEGTFKNNSKKYEEGMILYEGDVFEFNIDKFNNIINTVNTRLTGKNIEEISSEETEEPATDDNNNTEELVSEEISDDQIAEELGYSEDKIPSVLLRNTVGITAYVLYRAIKDPVLRKNILPKLTTEQQNALKEAGEKFDKAKAAKTKLVDNIKKGAKNVKTEKGQLSTIESAEQKITNAEKALEKAKANVTAEQNALNANTKYQALKTKYDDINNQIKKLEAQKAKNKTKRLSPDNEAKLNDLKNQKAELLKQKQAYEKNLNAAKKARREAKQNLKNAQLQQQVKSGKENITKIRAKQEEALKALKANSEYKAVMKDLNKLKSLENKVSKGVQLTEAETKLLKTLRTQKAALTKKLTALSKEYTTVTAELKAAQAELKTLENFTQNATTKSKVLSKIKAGKNKIKINLKKLPKSYVGILKSGLSKTSTVAKVGGTVLKGVGKVAKPVMAVVMAFDIYNAYQTGGTQKAVRQGAKLGTSMAGAWAGAKVGASIGATIGSIIPGVGTAAGGFVGGLIGGFVGWWAGEQAYDAAESIILPDETPLNQEAVQQGELELELDSEEIEALLEEYPELDDAIEISE